MNMKIWWAGVGRRLRCAAAACPANTMLAGAGVLMLAGAVVRLLGGSPYAHGLMLRFGHLMPPVWLMSLGWLIWYGILGAGFAIALCRARGAALAVRADTYRGGMLFLAMIFLGFLWYPLFFAVGYLLLSALLMLIIFLLCIGCGFSYLRACRPFAVVLLCHALWLLWLCAVSVAILFF